MDKYELVPQCYRLPASLDYRDYENIEYVIMVCNVYIVLICTKYITSYPGISMYTAVQQPNNNEIYTLVLQ